MSPPRSVLICGKRLKIKIKKLDDCHGQYVHDESTIYLSDDPGHAQEHWPTLLHEMVHACLAISGIAEVLGEKTEEAVCRSLEQLAPILALRPKNISKKYISKK